MEGFDFQGDLRTIAMKFGIAGQRVTKKNKMVDLIVNQCETGDDLKVAGVSDVDNASNGKGARLTPH